MSATPNYPVDVLKAGGWPNTAANRRFLNDWHHAEESSCDNNPLNNSQASPGGVKYARVTTPCMGNGGVCINAPDCIINYPSGDVGADGTAVSIKGTAPDVAAALATGKGYDAISQAAINEIYSWGSHDFARGLTPGKTPAGPGAGTGSGGGNGGGSSKGRPRPGGTNQGDFEQIIFGIPGTPDLPWQTIMSPLSIPGSIYGWAQGAFKDVTDIPGTLIQIGKTMLLAVKFFLWLLDPKHWVMVLEVIFGALLILHALNNFGKLFQSGSSTTANIFTGATRAATRSTAPRSPAPAPAAPKRTAADRRKAMRRRAIKRAAVAAVE